MGSGMNNWPENPKQRQHFSIEQSVRWEPYKPDGARQMNAPGRYQIMEWNGDFFKWKNTSDISGPEDLISEVESKKRAAAPELYEALEDLWTWVRNWDTEFMDDDEFDRTKYEDALIKARGESQ